jgi:glutaryl-CoA dehydrogenase
MNRTIVQHTCRRLVACRKSLDVGRRHTHAPAAFNWEDPLNSATLFTEDELAIQETAHDYCQERMLPRVLGVSGLCTSLMRYSADPGIKMPIVTNIMIKTF